MDTYSQTPGVTIMHHMPRFGHDSDFSKLVSSNQSEQIDYVMGLLALSFFVFSLFVLWGATLLTFGFMGTEQLGFLAGRVRIIANQYGKFQPPPVVWKIRSLFIILGCGIIGCNYLVIGPGLRKFQRASVSTRKLNRDVNDLVTQGILIMDSLSRVQGNLDRMDVASVIQVEDTCPNFGNNTFVTDEEFHSSLQTIQQEFDDLGTYLNEDDFDQIRHHVNVIMDGSTYVESGITVLEKNDWIVRMFALALSILVFYMIFATSVAWYGKSTAPVRCTTMILVLPLYLMLMVIGWLITSFMASAAILNADFCAGGKSPGSPIGTVLRMFEERGIGNDDVLFRAFTYYQSGCTTQDPIEHLYKYEDGIQSGIESAQKFLSHAEEVGIDTISERCGVSVFPVIEGVGLLKDNLGILLGALRSSFEVASCSKISPIYRRTFDGAACSDSVEGLIMIFSLMLAISTMGMILILLRSAMFPCKKVYSHMVLCDDENDEWEEYQAYLNYVTDFLSIWGASNNDDASRESGEKSEDSESTSQTSSDSGTESTSRSSRSNEHDTAGDDVQLTARSCEELADEEVQPTARSYDDSADEEVQRTDRSCEYNTVDEEVVSTACSNSPLSLEKVEPEDDTEEDDECRPLSPDHQSCQNSFAGKCDLFTSPQSNGFINDDDEECQPLTPDTPPIESSVKPRSWRSVESVVSSNQWSSPMSTSPGGSKVKSFFTGAINMSNFISPVKRGNSALSYGSLRNDS